MFTFKNDLHRRATRIGPLLVLLAMLGGCATGHWSTNATLSDGAVANIVLGPETTAYANEPAVVEGVPVEAPIAGLPGAVWSDANNDGLVDGYVFNGQYYPGVPPGGYGQSTGTVASGAGAAVGSTAGTVVPGYHSYTTAYASRRSIDCSGLPTLGLAPPRPSAQPLTLDNAVFLREAATLLGVAKTLLAALRQAGYEEQSFYCVPGGFALATAVERIRSDKTPWPGDDRWNLQPMPLVRLDQDFSLNSLIQAVMHADPGDYRMIVFYVTDRPLGVPTVQPGPNFRSLPQGGPDEPRSDWSEIAYTAQHRVHALVYEFRRASVASPAYFVSSTLPTAIQLRRAGLMRRLK